MKSIVHCLAIALLVAVFNGDVWAQATAQISGTVKDQSGAVLPGVEVTATQTSTGVARNTITNETGSYVLPNLPIGPYRLEASLPGFRTYVQTGIVLEVNSSPVINVVLEVGQVTEQVEVQANAAMVETRNVSVGQVIENARILELPLNGRDVRDLITLTGGAVETGSRGILGRWISVNGGLGYGVSYTLDGANHVNYTSGTGMPMPFPDALQEFKVENSGVTAQTGNAAAVGAVTKSGTNEFHGDLFEFVRNDLFNARNYFATKGSTLKRNQFGGTFGGPIAQNKLFFFGGYQGTTLRQDPSDVRQFVPTPAMLAGDWTAFASPACNSGRQRALRAPFVNGHVDPSLFSPAAAKIVSQLPKAQNDCGEITFGRRSVIDDKELVGRVDFQASSKHTLFGRYYALFNLETSPFKFTPDNILNAGVNGNDELAQSVALGSTYLLSPNIIHSLRVAYNRTAQLRVGQKYFSACDVGIKTYCGYSPTWMYVTVTGGFSLRGTSAPGTSAAPNDYIVDNYQINDDLSIVLGTHQFSLGGNAIRSNSHSNSYFVSAGQMSFRGSALGLGMADFMLGRMTTLVQGANGNHSARQYMFAAYGTDTWKARQNLTLTYGLRWEPYIPQTLPTGVIYQFDINRFQKGIYSKVFNKAPAGFYYPGDPGFPGLKGQDNQWMQFAPRLGLAWDLNGDGRTSIRASYAYGYNFVSLDWRRDQNGSSPFANRTALTSVNLDDPYRDLPGGMPFPVDLGPNAKFAPSGAFLTSRYDARTPATGSWNLSLQRQLGQAWLISTTYMGSETSHLWVQRALNPAVYMPGASCVINGVTHQPCSSLNNTDDRRLLTLLRPVDGEFIGPVAEFSDGGTQSYNGMLVSVQRRVSSGLTLSGNYTLSHCIGDYADEHSMGPGADETYTDPNNRRLDRGNCNGDRRSVFNTTAVVETPRFGNATLQTLVSGWRLSGIYRASSGSPLLIESGTDRALTGIATQRPDKVIENVFDDRSAGPFSRYLNPAAFALPAEGKLGNLARNAIRGPRSWAFDVALSRVFRLRETQRLEFRAEAYNLTNSFRPIDPIVDLSNANFGVIRESRDPRIMQFALKYVF